MKILYSFPTFGWMLRIEWKVQNLWIGCYWKNRPDRIDIWICLMPCVAIHYASPVDEPRGE